MYDHGGQVLRREKYGRAEVEKVQKDLMDGQNQPAPNSLRDRLTRTYSPDGAGDVERRLAG